MNATAETDTGRRLGDLAAILDTMAFPAAREDLLLHAIASHATPALIGELRALEASTFENATSVRDALAHR